MNNIATHSDKLFANTRKKIILVVTVISMIVMLLFSGVVIFTYQFVMFNTVDAELEQYKEHEDAMLKSYFDDDMLPMFDRLPSTPTQEVPGDDILDDYAGERGMRYIRFFFVENQMVWSSSEGYYPSAAQIDLSDFKEDTILKFNLEGEHFRGFMVRRNNVSVVTAINVTPEYESISKVVLAVAIGFLAVFVVVVFVASYYSKKIVAPLKDAYIKQAYFVQDASHEMRTPLAVIRGKMELMAQCPNDEIQEHSQELSDIISELAAMEKMNSGLLMLSKEEAFVNHDISSFRLNDMLGELSDELFSILAEAQGKSFSFSIIPQDVVVDWDYAKMKQAFTILLDNAFKYTLEGDEIRVTATQSRDNIIISFYDSGRGIKSEDLPRIFDRFYRADDVRAQEISGSGIGLSLLTMLGSNLGFKIAVVSEQNEFTEFVLTIPTVMK